MLIGDNDRRCRKGIRLRDGGPLVIRAALPSSAGPGSVSGRDPPQIERRTSARSGWASGRRRCSFWGAWLKSADRERTYGVLPHRKLGLRPDRHFGHAAGGCARTLLGGCSGTPRPAASAPRAVVRVDRRLRPLAHAVCPDDMFCVQVACSDGRHRDPASQTGARGGDLRSNCVPRPHLHWPPVRPANVVKGLTICYGRRCDLRAPAARAAHACVPRVHD